MGMSFIFLVEDVHHRIHDGRRHALAAQHLSSRSGEFLREGAREGELEHDQGGGLPWGDRGGERFDVLLTGETRRDRLEAVEIELSGLFAVEGVARDRRLVRG